MEPIAEAGDVYAQQLFPVGFGHPLWRPEPNLRTGREVLVGDVGFIRRGHFSPLFNTTKPATDPINCHKGIPTDFQVLSLPDTSISRSDRIMQDMVCSGGVSAVKVEEGIAVAGGPASLDSKWTLRSAADAGAFVVLDPPGVAEDIIESRPHIVDYMRENFDSWFQLANVQRGIGLKEHEIIFVCGVLKTTRWGVGAFQHEEIHNMEGRVFGQLGVFGDAGFSLDFDRKILPGSHCNTGPSLLGVLREPGALLWLRSRLVYLFRGYDIERVPALQPAWDPVSPLLDYILDNSRADVAIASDIDVTELFRGSETFPDADNLPKAIRRLSPAVEVDQHGVGTVSVDSLHHASKGESE